LDSLGEQIAPKIEQLLDLDLLGEDVANYPWLVVDAVLLLDLRHEMVQYLQVIWHLQDEMD
jgi:hypothetical protein